MRVFGKNAVSELLKNDEKVQKAYIATNFNDQNLILALTKKQIDIKKCSKWELDKLEKGNHQGIIIDVPDYKYANINELIKEDAFLVILDHLEDTHNLGAIIRTAEAAGVNGIIIPKDRSVSVNGTVMKISAGALEYMKVVQVTNINETIAYLKKQGFWIIGTDMEGTCYSEIDYKGKIALVIGNEAKGISKLVKQNCDFLASIPMNGKINSLNASVAAGIVIFEANRLRK
jgi:23S rRNA (guanosine2251-2'-O)-methyltransferase